MIGFFFEKATCLDTIVYALLGIVIGTIGTLIGAGGGFLLVPILIFLFPDYSASQITAISMLAVLANSCSGSIAYSLRKQVHWKSVLLYTMFAIPGIYSGVLINRYVSRNSFATLFGIFVIILSSYLILKTLKKNLFVAEKSHTFQPPRHIYIVGSFVSIFIGLISAFFGIGGGVIHVPLLSTVLLYPVHLAAGTSHMILALTSTFGVWEHYQLKSYAEVGDFQPYLIVGVVVGAQFGAYLSKHVSSINILRILSICLLFVGLRMIFL